MSQDAISALKAGGIPVDALSPEQRSALTNLSQDEIKTLVSVHQRVRAAENPDVEGHAFEAGTGIF